MAANEEVRKYKLEDGKRVERGVYLRDSAWGEDEKDFYIVGINNWIINSEGKFLVQKRALSKKNNPGKLSSTNGLVQLGENDIEAVQRETREELGIIINPDRIFLYDRNHIAGDHLLVDIYVSQADVSLDDIVVQESEVDEVRFVSLEELLKMDISTTCSYIISQGPDILKYYFEQSSKK